MTLRRFRMAAGLLLLLAGCGRESAPLPHDAYVWQRVWTPAVGEALRESAADIRMWRVLAAQTDGRGRLRVFQPDRAALAASDRPVLLVIRIDGQLAHWDEASLLADTEALWRDWQRDGITVAGVEIDHDCGTARLPDYARYLGKVRARLQPALLSITALPAWRDAPALAAVLAEVDESVLQVHAVRDPRAGLFDGALALHWAREYAQRSDKPFRLALPNYGSRVSWDAQGRLASVQSEALVDEHGEHSRELLALPQTMSAFLAQVHADPPPHLQGIVWFRLPTAQDSRAWSIATWLAVIRGQPVVAKVTATTRPGNAPGMLELVLRNDGTLDAALPARVRLPASCRVADGVNGYARAGLQAPWSIERLQPGLLRARHQRVVGWARCGTTGVDLHVDA